MATHTVTLNTPYATLSFQSLFQPRNPFNEPEAHYEATFLFDAAAQKSPAFKAMQDAVKDVAAKAFPGVPLKALKLPFKDAGEKADKYAGYNVGDVSIKARSTRKPGVVNAQRQDILLAEEVWSGQLVRANVTAFDFNANGVRGITFGLNHVQIIKSDTARLDGRSSPSSAFDDGVVTSLDDESPF